jgi:hypothetical protein
MALYATGHTYNARNDQLVATGVAVIAAAAALSMKNHIDEVLLGIPVAFLLLATYAAQVDTDAPGGRGPATPSRWRGDGQSRDHSCRT